MWTPPLSYRSLLATAIIAALYTAVVSATLLWEYTQRSRVDVVQSAELLEAHGQLRADPQNADLRSLVRDLDRNVRQAYFRRQLFAQRGALLLAVGLAVTVFASTAAAALRRTEVSRLAGSADIDSDEILARCAVPAVFVVAGLLAAGGVALHTGYSHGLPTNTELTIALTPATESSSGEPAGAEQKVAYPTWEQLAENWPRFRGVSGAGHTATSSVPVQWSTATGEGMRWKTVVPLDGNSSPVVWQKRVFLSGATVDQQQVYCFDADDGHVMWTATLPLSPWGMPEVSEDTGYAAPTMVTDGQSVFVIFASGDVGAFDFDGSCRWQLNLGPLKNAYGHASSLEIFQDRLIVQLDQGSKADGLSRLLGVHTVDGGLLWQIPRDVPNSWPSPIVVEHRQEPLLITCGSPWVVAHDPRDGRELWRAKCLQQDVGPSPVYADGTVIVANEFPGVSVISADGQGDVSDSGVLWTAEFGAPDTCSPLIINNLVLLLASYGTLTCYDLQSGGEPLWEEDFDDTFRSSPSCAGGAIYLFGESGKCWVVQPRLDGCERVAEAELGEDCFSSPAFSNSRIFVRGKRHLFCLEKQGS